MNPKLKQLLRWLVAAAAIAMAADPAAADAIDGNWCSGDGRTFTIRGSAIVTPRGNQLQGNYDRHFFSYVVPANEPGAGRTVNMTLLGENTVRIEADAANVSATEIWNRCGPSVSGLPRLMVSAPR